jgi:hypothetical protein
MQNETNLEKLLQKKKENVDAKYGIGTFDQSARLVNPHRCAQHVNDVFFGLSNNLDFSTIPLAFQCFLSAKGQEPPRKYTNSIEFLMKKE